MIVFDTYHIENYSREKIIMTSTKSNSLLVVWTSGEIDVAKKMVFMYSLNSKLNNWWDDVTLLVWGPSSYLLANHSDLQKDLQEMRDAGVKVIACKACAEKYGIVSQLEKIGIKVFYIGEYLTNWIKSENHIHSRSISRFSGTTISWSRTALSAAGTWSTSARVAVDSWRASRGAPDHRVLRDR